jgi:hypothetical protein
VKRWKPGNLSEKIKIGGNLNAGSLPRFGLEQAKPLLIACLKSASAAIDRTTKRLEEITKELEELRKKVEERT